MRDRLIVLLIAGIFSLISSPTILMAADNVKVTGLDTADAVETVVEPVTEVAETVIDAPAAPVAGYATVATAPEIVNYTVTGYSGEISVNPVGIMKTGNLIYGHNSWDLMGSLASRYVGEVFTITEGGVTRNYQVAAVMMYEKTADGYLNGNPYLMGDLLSGAMGHSVAMMTCAGQMLGGGDATHRLVVFADAV